ncbi:MAG: hypothetical protein HQK72_03135 [Desulfamplus sp.]|nr:hypothetical protein [Desulfamplus sp.]
MNSSTLINIYTASLEKYLDNTDSIIILLLDEKLTIQDYNKPFIKLITSRGLFRRIKVGDIKGESILNFLTQESCSVFNACEDREVDFIKNKLNFSVSGSPSMTVSCYIFRVDHCYLIIGEQITLTESHFMDKMSILNNEMTNMVREIQQKNREIQQKNREIQHKNIELEKAYSQIKILSGIIPICMHCKGIRDDQGYWNKVEEYITQHSDAQFSHGICPKCMEKYYSEYL